MNSSCCRVSLKTTDSAGEEAGGHVRPAAAAAVRSARRTPQTARPGFREGDQTKGAGGEGGESCECGASVY